LSGAGWARLEAAAMSCYKYMTLTGWARVAEANARGWILGTRPSQKSCPAFSFLVGTQLFLISGLKNAVDMKNKEEEIVSSKPAG
jgi:hypothetical protein